MKTIIKVKFGSRDGTGWKSMNNGFTRFPYNPPNSDWDVSSQDRTCVLS